MILNMKHLMFEKKRLISEKEWLMSEVRDRISQKKYPIIEPTFDERSLCERATLMNWFKKYIRT